MTPEESSNELLMLLLQKGYSLLPVETQLAELFATKCSTYEIIDTKYRPNPSHRHIIVCRYEFEQLYWMNVVFYAFAHFFVDRPTEAKVELLSFGRIGDWKSFPPGNDLKYNQMLTGSLDQIPLFADKLLVGWQEDVRICCMYDRKRRRAHGDIFS